MESAFPAEPLTVIYERRTTPCLKEYNANKAPTATGGGGNGPR